jgi:diadenosine tetraphosphate (Ap4A) HIT family hydrolase
MSSAEAADCPLCRQVQVADREPAGEDVVCQLPYSVVFLGPWQYYHGYCVVVARRHATELSQLPEDERRGYLEEMCLVARAIEECFRPDKLNYELLGNQVPHPHWHLFPRRRDDPEALKPVWLALDRAERDPAERARLQAAPLGRAETAGRLCRKLQDLRTGPS